LSELKTPDGGAAVLIAAASGRALAAAARRAGYLPLVADFFDDADTRSLSAATCRVGDPDAGFDAKTLIPALERLAEGRAPVGLVYASGFEDRVELLDEIARRWTLFGNKADSVRRAKNPVLIAELCRALRIPHPEISLAPPPNAEGWLVKNVGGAGGSHVALASAWRASDENIYFQRVAPGEPVSILSLCDGREALDHDDIGLNQSKIMNLTDFKSLERDASGKVVSTFPHPALALGSSRQWAAPSPDEPFRFGGCVRPAGQAADVERRLIEAANSLAAAIGLVGLNSFDFLVAGEAFALIEINPRPGATLDIFENGLLFEAHIDACRGILPPASLEFTGATATQIAYARREIAAMPAFDWPAWTADRPRAGSALRLYDPLCTIKACAADPERARALVTERTACLLDRIDQLGERDIERDGAEHQHADGTSR
jgi:predicted ATP-grasp superfamily ATP-dependent carboligase